MSTVLIILALLIVPPFISVRRYKNRITQVISASLGHPVRLSSVELRILPRPSFVITDLVVEEDPAYGAEPVLHASTVTASIRLVPLWWRAKLAISRISVDEASLNLVRAGNGRWNFDSFFRTAAARAQSGGNDGAIPFPYLEATDSRVNIKDGVEKLPYSLVNADISFWQESPDEWRVRLKGQPARTDVSLDLGDTGIIRLEGRMGRAPDLRRIPIRLDLDWRQAQLGQLTRLVLGSDEGWRGDLTGEIHVEGMADAAQVTTRLRASGVHREEFAPVAAMGFDATCKFLYHSSETTMDDLLCDSPIGDGRARLTGNMAKSASPQLSLELDRVPAQVALDALRTVRRGIDPTLQAEGAISGRMVYAPTDASQGRLAQGAENKSSVKTPRGHAPPPGPLSGLINVVGLHVSGEGLSKPINMPRVTLEPAPGVPPALLANVAIAAGAAAPLNLTARLTTSSYEVTVRGGAALGRIGELARAAGLSQGFDVKGLAGPPAAVDLSANGPWVRAPGSTNEELAALSPASLPPAPVLVSGVSDQISGAIVVHGATWKADFLANPVELSNAVLHFGDSGTKWDPVTFTYGSVHGSATLAFPADCATPSPCPAEFTIEFGALDAAELQSAILGARQPGTLMSNLLARFSEGSTPNWPELDGTLRAKSLALGPVMVNNAAAAVEIRAKESTIRSLDGDLFGGRVHAEGSVLSGKRPDYKFKGQFEELSAAEVGHLLGMTWSGNTMSGSGDIELSGFTDHDLAASAKGLVHFDWRHGSVEEVSEGEVPPVLAHFDRWTADAEIANSTITLKQNQVQRGAHSEAVDASAILGDTPRVTFGRQPDARAADGRRGE